MPRIILTTGGTGGHIFPALATAEAIREARPDADLLFMGATYGPEKEMAQKAGLPFCGLPGRGILGRGLKAIPAMRDNLVAVAKAIKAVRAFSPCVVAAFGGYASFAPAVAARLLRIPLLLHEQNAICGASNRLLGRFASTLCISLPQTTGFARPCVITGNPVRKNIGRAAARRMPGRKLFVYGGSQGAHALNMLMKKFLPRLAASNVEILHQTGARDIDEMRAAYEAAGYARQCAQPFIDDMESAYAWADIALCRAGASCLAELCAAELPAILVPFPHAIHDHQTLNAKNLSDAGAAILLPEARLDEAFSTITNLLDNRAKLTGMSRAAATLARPDAAGAVAAEILKLCSGKAGK